ncbi:MAG TPA: IclR family transcriptional regulator C-terminal domain-containing protein [Microvirga sp.]|nr:IclR family transcriptional regulator C-terminal domain-containing protein [Microvirga sp.]
MRRYTAPALEKGLDIIELLARESRPLAMPEIAQHLGRSKSEIFRNLRILEERGYLARANGSDQFALTNRLFQMGMRSPPTPNLIEAAYPAMADAARTIDQSVHLGVQSREQMVVVARVENPGGVVFTVPIGHRGVLSETASGRVLLAFQRPEVQQEWIGLVRQALGSRFRAKALRRQLDAIRARGHELCESAGIAGVTDVSFPVFDPAGQAVAAVTTPTIVHLKQPTDLEAVVAAMRAAAERINGALATPLTP